MHGTTIKVMISICLPLECVCVWGGGRAVVDTVT